MTVEFAGQLIGEVNGVAASATATWALSASGGWSMSMLALH